MTSLQLDAVGRNKKLAAMCGALTLASLASPVCATSPAETCCSALASQRGLQAKIYYPNTTLYSDRMSTYWSLSAALDPWCVAQPEGAKDVSSIVKTLAANDCPFGIRGGGHGFFALSNSVAEGVTIDLGYLNTTKYDAATKIASVQPGSHWQEVYDTLSPQGVTVAGGRAGTVGVGGFLSGGGNSFYAASHGMACDTVANFEVVLADGCVVNANADENPDLFSALKGGSGNFGVVTRFDMYAIEFPNATDPAIWGGILIYDLSAGDALIDAMVSFTEAAAGDRNTSSILYWAYLPALGGMVLNAALENTLGVENPPAAEVYLNVSGITSNTMRRADLAVITSELGAGQPAGFRNDWRTLGFGNDARVMRFAVAAHEFAVAQLNATMTPDSGFNTLCMFQPLNNVIARHGAEKGGNVMGLDYWMDGGDGIMFLATLAVNGAENEANAAPIMKNWTDSVAAYADELGVGWGWHYLNYASPDQDPLASVGPENIASLQAASAKYDPHGVFQRLRTSGFKIPQRVEWLGSE
ncbi:hypothetical protein SLS64_013374 [Diaporthe eres]|uniref:FAD-binding PCMH-type domain-containing protein n=1 Tax=Diaporthe eres TaxID=83184 RepID=A0ABR1NLP4_DIAER